MLRAVCDTDRISVAAAAGTVAQGCCCSANGRLYPCGLLQREVERLQALLKTQSLHGELLHPDSRLDSFRDVCPAAACHEVHRCSGYLGLCKCGTSTLCD